MKEKFVYVNSKKKQIQTEKKYIDVAIIDSGIDESHFHFKGTNLTVYDYCSTGSIDRLGHGTMIASQLTGESDYLSGVYKYVNIIMYKVIDINLTNSYWRFEKALLQAISDKVDIINMSIGFYLYLNKHEKTFEKLKGIFEMGTSKGIIFISSAGYENSSGNSNQVHVPSVFESVISVASVSQLGTKMKSFEKADYYLQGGSWTFENAEFSYKDLCIVCCPLFNYSSHQLLARGITFTAGHSIATAKLSGLVCCLLGESIKKLTLSDIKNKLDIIATDRCIICV